MANNFNLNVEQVLNIFNCRQEYRRDDIKAYIKYDLEDGKNTDKFIMYGNGELYCNVAGAKVIGTWLNRIVEDYEETFIYFNNNKRKTEMKRDLCTDINIKYNEEEQKHFGDIFMNDYISKILQEISLNGKYLDEIDTDKLSDRDRATINGSIKVYNKTAKAGHNNQSDRILKSYRYVEENDPDIAKRALYNFDYTEIDLDEQWMKLRNMDFCYELRKALKINRKKANKRLKNKKNQKFINSLYDTQNPDKNV